LMFLRALLADGVSITTCFNSDSSAIVTVVYYDC
jgi:hypothetical protein